MSIITYTRLITINQSSGHSLDTQKNISNEYASNNNMNIIKISPLK